MRYQHDVLRLVCGDESTAIAASGEVHASHMPYPMTVTGVRASLTNGPTTGTMLVDVEEEGVSILASPIELTAGETSSTGASNLPFIVDNVLGDAARIAVIVVDEASGDAAGLKVDIIGHRWIIPFVEPYGLSGPSGEGVGLPVVPIPPPPASPTVTINQGSGQADPTIVASIVFDVVFSASVVGFATGDVTLAGTAPGTLVGTVAGSGTTYTVTVTGMTGPGTVIASIGAGVCVSTVGARPNLASTSTDNTVTFAGTPLTILGAKLIAWWDGHDPAATGTPPSPGEVTTWFDKTANAHNIGRQAVGGGASYTANVVNGQGVMRFDGTNDGMFSSAPFIYAQGDCEIWFVARSDESGLGVIIGESRSDTPNLAYRIYDNETVDDYVFNLENSAGTTRFTNTQDRSTNDWDLVICTDLGAATGTSNEVVDVDAGTTGAYTRDSVTMTRLTVGFQQTNAQSLFFDGDIADILVLDAPASSGERTALAAYFNAKYAKSWTPA